MTEPVRLLDSNVVMGDLNQDSTPHFIPRVEQCFSEGAAVSIIALIEVLGWRGHDDRSRSDAELLLRSLQLVDLSAVVVAQTIGLRSSQAIKLPDAVIAASALVHRLTLATRNVQDFDRIPELVVRNPFDAGPFLPHQRVTPH